MTIVQEEMQRFENDADDLSLIFLFRMLLLILKRGCGGGTARPGRSEAVKDV
jgi:hypothetical protein